MNTMPAAALTCDSDIRPRHGGAERHGAAERRGDAEILPLRASRPAGTPAVTRPAVTRPAGLRSAAPRPAEPPAPPLRLTRRGRVVVAAMAALLVTVLSLLAAGAAQASNHAPSPGAARQDLVQVTVRPGQSLWSVAESTDPDQDTRAVVQQIVDLNSLTSDVVFAGQQLWVPRG